MWPKTSEYVAFLVLRLAGKILPFPLIVVQIVNFAGHGNVPTGPASVNRVIAW